MTDPVAGRGPDAAAFPSTGADAAGTPVVDVPAGQWVEAARHVRDTLGMDFFDWLSAVDIPDGDPPGADVVVHVASSSRPGPPGGAPAGVRRLLLRTRVADADPHLPSLTSVWPGAAWHERETFEMFGITFDGFDDGSGDWLRPLLLPDGFEGTPLRKAFVLAARASKPWPGAKEPGESDAHAAPGRRKTLPPGVPDTAAWGPRDPGAPPPDAAPTSSGPARTGGERGAPAGAPRRTGARSPRRGGARPLRRDEESPDA
ncbi:MAG TPA: NADH-quinone oxidoreductase subunit C [Kineosporiaceae bacterium]|nr:NADH-quinone oxidoreductase subunit C [Kineosporiaceae bacterium]